ncbi:MAG: hypothetical protein KDA80_07730 [Planctomycetaceae bacterium]|nr:hypothetical protein [Planctomycetaceae bacterium]
MKRVLLTAVALLAVSSWSTMAFGQLEFERAPIRYSETEPNDAVAKLMRQVESGEVSLNYDLRHGYLADLLRELNVPISSQTLVFSKTSLQIRRISPAKPRALYFNDDIYVGWVQDGDVIELSAVDPVLGPVFYTLSQKDRGRASLARDQGHCLTCHASSRTQGVPGFVMRSVFPDRSGQPHYGSGTYTLDQTTPFERRWGGWYVTGSHGDMRHLGNAVSAEEMLSKEEIEAGANVCDLSPLFDVTPYLTDTSDVVALMVLEHQTQMHNFLTLANFESRIALDYNTVMAKALDRPEDELSESTQRRIASVGEKLIKHLLFVDEFSLTSPVKGNSTFAEDFQALGSRDSQGRSLRDLDLQTRLFKYPCSFLILNESFKQLPKPVLTYVMTRLTGILQGTDESGEFDHLTPADRMAIREILQQEIPELMDTKTVTVNSDVD